MKTSDVTVAIPENLARFIHLYFVLIRHRMSAPLGPVPGPTDFSPLQDKFLADVAQALHNITGTNDQGAQESSGARFFYQEAKRINAAWIPAKALLLPEGQVLTRKFEKLFPLPERSDDDTAS